VHLWRCRLKDHEWIAAYAGTGVQQAIQALAEVEKEGEVSLILSIGWVGALREGFDAGQVFRVSTVIDARTGERYATAQHSSELLLVTTSKVANEEEKRRLAATYGAGLVDMEAAGLARLAEARQIPFYCIKGVSDGPNEKLPELNRFISNSGKFLFLPFLTYVLFRPAYWPALMRMGENSKRAAKNLAAAVLDFLDERGNVRGLNGNSNSGQ
jgi:adenosylhomocysteine nucleosidase